MKKSRLVLLAAGVLSAPMTMAAGFQLNEHSVSGAGRAYAGEAAMADNASTLARNPAVLSVMSDRQMSFVGHYIDPDVDVEGKHGVDGARLQASLSRVLQARGVPAATANAQAAGAANLVSANTGSVDASADDIAPTAFIPGFYYAAPGGEDSFFSWGAMVNSYFGLSTDYGSGYAASELANKTSIETVALSFPMAFKVADNLSLGLTLSLIQGEGEIKNNSSRTLQTVTGVLTQATVLSQPIAAGTSLLSVDGDGTAFGYQLGLLWDIADGHRLGFRYQGETEMKFEGDVDIYESTVPGGTPGQQTYSGSLTIDLPAVIELGYVWDMDENWTFLAGFVQTQWSSFENLTADFDGTDVLGRGSRLLKEENWDDASRYSVGVEFKGYEDLTVRFGIAKDESPVKPEFRTLTIPDADRSWVTYGATWDPSSMENSSFDFSLIYIVGEEVAVDEGFVSNGVELSRFQGKLSSTDAFIYSFGYNYTF